MKKQIRYTILVALLIVVFQPVSYGNNPLSKSSDTKGKIKVTIIYDNFNFKEGLKSDWGFSCLIQGTDQTILFDTGARKSVFEQNFEALSIDPKEIGLIVISHDHYDHTGGLETFLEKNSDVYVYIIESFAQKSKKLIEEIGGKIRYEPNLTEICKDVYLSGTLGDKIEEQSLAINTDKGLVVITGCSHPGINKILEHFKTSLNKDIYMVFGGFHLMQMNEEEMKSIISEMKELGVQRCGATHCTGKKQIEMFKDSFGDNYVSLGVGNVIEF